MAKPSWINIVSGGTGSGSGTRSLQANPHTGRSRRTGTIKGTTSGGASDSVSLTQAGAGEFIYINNGTLYGISALEDTIEITGTSNSPSLKLMGDNLDLISGWALEVNGTAIDWDGDSKHLIPGDPGASSEYTFKITCTVSENQTESARTMEVYLTDSGTDNIPDDTNYIIISQAAGEKTYGIGTASLSYKGYYQDASGGTATPSYSFSIPWGWNGEKTGGGTLTKADSHTISYAYRDNGPDSPYDWVLYPDGHIFMASLGKNIAPGSDAIYIKATIKIADYTLYAEEYVIQGANKITYTLTSASVSLPDIPASGGTASPEVSSVSGKLEYSSGETETQSLTPSDITLTLSETITGSNLGTTIKARTKLGRISAVATWKRPNNTITTSLDVYQQANKVTYSDVEAKSQGVNPSKTGGDIDIAAVVKPEQTATYTSGVSETITDFTYEFTSIPSWITVDELTLNATVGKNITGLIRDSTIDITITGSGNKSTAASIQVYQESLTIPYWTLSESETYAKNESSIVFSIMDPDKVWYKTILSESWMSLREEPGETLGIVCADNLTESERTGTVQLMSNDGTDTVFATCTVTQEAKTLPTWNLGSTFVWDYLGQSSMESTGGPEGMGLEISDPDNAGWEIYGSSDITGSSVDTASLSLPISGTGDYSIGLSPGSNSGTKERSYEISLNLQDGTVLAICECTQEAKS